MQHMMIMKKPQMMIVIMIDIDLREKLIMILTIIKKIWTIKN